MRKLPTLTKPACLLLAGLFALGTTACAAPADTASSSAPASATVSSASTPQSEAAENIDPTLVETGGGLVRGALAEGVRSFKAIPYAAPPLGELRCQPPRPAASWPGERDCTAFGEMATQPLAHHHAGLSYGEDCLTLNIWAPEEGEGLPVYVFIHGGGFAQGAPGMASYDGTRFAKNGVIQVNIGYRLGALGFLPMVERVAESGYAGNWGLLDQIAALRWVKDNIAAFGGDVNNITIGGESAGAFSVSGLILSPLATGLFHKAILESGNILGQPLFTPSASGKEGAALTQGGNFLGSMGLANPEALQAADAQTLAKASYFSSSLIYPNPGNFWPIFDGAVLPKDPCAALTAGDYQPVSILTGFNSDEGVLFVPEGLSEGEYADFVTRAFGDEAAAVLARYPVDAGHTATDRARFLAKMGLRLGGDLFAETLAAAGGDVYCYQYGYNRGNGALHGDEVNFVFDTAGALNEAGESVKEDLHARWLAFIRDGKPGSGLTGVE